MVLEAFFYESSGNLPRLESTEYCVSGTDALPLPTVSSRAKRPYFRKSPEIVTNYLSRQREHKATSHATLSDHKISRSRRKIESILSHRKPKSLPALPFIRVHLHRLFCRLCTGVTRFTQPLWVIPAENGPNYAGITRRITYYSTVTVIF